MPSQFTYTFMQLVGALLFLITPCAWTAERPWVEYQPPDGAGKGKHLVLLAGDEEYRSEEGLPMLGKILSQRHGFRCTVLFSVNPDGTINPEKQESLSHPEALDSADAIVILLRFRDWPDDVMKHFVDAYHRGVPIIALRTSTHAFQLSDTSAYKQFDTFGERVLGEEWVSHWGRHKVEATRGVLEPSAKDHPILRGVSQIFGDTDVYEAYPPDDATILVRGEVLKGMNPDDPPARYRKKRASDKKEQDVNEPMMPVAWTRIHKNEAGNTNRIFCTTMGSATDLESEGLRRLVVNAVYWGLEMEVPERADVRYVGPFEPTMYGFGGYKKGVRPSDHALNRDTGASVPLKLNPGDHVAILGNALPDRMQHSGYFETLVHAAFPEHKLVFRNLSAAGDEVGTWFRSENFGSRDEWLSKVQADVIFAFYGFNEALRGKDELEQFRTELDRFLKETGQKQFGKGKARIVLFSPIASERHVDPNFPDPATNNELLAAYTAVMKEVARANEVQFVNLFEPSSQLFDEASSRGESLTVNGHYLTSEGDRLLAPEIFHGVFGFEPPQGEFERLRNAVNDKNWQWHQRYRTVDGYNVYGGRSALAYEPNKPGFVSDRSAPPPRISNYKVMQQEMAQRDVMTANRDIRVWAAAKGEDYPIDDSNLPPVIELESNKPGPGPDGQHIFLSGEEAISKMTVHSGMQVNLFADEEQFPDLVNPVQMAWDTKGRLWVAVWPNYPGRKPTSKHGDSLLIFEDTTGDGKADKQTTFISDLNAPTGFQFYKDGVLLMQAPDLWFLRDNDGDGRADEKERVLMGMDSADSHHTANAICLDPGGAIYLSDGVFHRTQVETAFGTVRNRDAAIYRFEPRTGRFETYIAYGFANPHGRVFDRWGNDIVTDATGNANYFGPAFSGRLDYEKGKHPGMKQFWDRPSRPCPGTGILTSRHFPEEFQDNFLNINVISFHGVYRVQVSEEGSGLRGDTQEHLIHSTDPNFRPVAINVGPDGAIYIADWHNPIIGHMQHHLRDPSRDKQHGRIYRITYKGRPLMKPVQIDGAPVPALLDLLKEPENQTRELAKVELGERDTAEVIPALKPWIEGLDAQSAQYEHHLMEALWVHQWHNVVDRDLLERMLNSPDHRARAAAGRVLCYWRDRISGSLALFRRLAEDEHPRVRLEAVRGASFYDSAEAAEVALAVVKHPMDYYLEYALKETLRQLESYWRKAISEGKPFAADNPAGIERLISTLKTSDLEKLPPSEAVLSAILFRRDATDAMRMIALDKLSKQRGSLRTVELLALLERAAKENAEAGNELARLLPLLPVAELQQHHARLSDLAQSSGLLRVRQASWAALALVDDGFASVFSLAHAKPATLMDLMAGIPLLPDPEFRGKAYEHVKPLLTSVPAGLENARKTTGAGQFVRIELPRTGTLTLAEVQVMSNGRNIARQGKAKQSSTAHGGTASRAIDGRTDGEYGSGTQTHTNEEVRPWWEVDLGAEHGIDSIVIWNRSEDPTLAARLDGFTMTVLDSSRQKVFQRTAIAAPPKSVSIPVSGIDLAGALRRSAIDAIASMSRGHEETFAALATLIDQGTEVVSAARGIRKLSSSAWSNAEAAIAAAGLVRWAKNVPISDRTSQECVEVLQLANDLAGLMPVDAAVALRKDLKEMRVAVFVIRAVREQMRFDTPRIVVEAGKPFELIIENADFMPHNLVIVIPGARQKVGTIADTMRPDQVDRQGRAFVPRTADIVAATKLLESGEMETLKLTAPETEGEYEYVCTFPGHWQVMWGQLIVTKDVDGYLLGHPEAVAIAPAANHHQHFE